MNKPEMDKPEMAQFVTEVPIADRDGVPICGTDLRSAHEPSEEDQ